MERGGDFGLADRREGDSGLRSHDGISHVNPLFSFSNNTQSKILTIQRIHISLPQPHPESFFPPIIKNSSTYPSLPSLRRKEIHFPPFLSFFYIRIYIHTYIYIVYIYIRARGSSTQESFPRFSGEGPEKPAFSRNRGGGKGRGWVFEER